MINSKGEEVTEEVWEEESNEAANKALDKTNAPASKSHILFTSMLCLVEAQDCQSSRASQDGLFKAGKKTYLSFLIEHK